MGIEDKRISEISQPVDLVVAFEQVGSSIVITDKEAEMLLGYMTNHDYVVGYAEGNLYRGDLDEIPGEIVWEDYSADDLIDLICEWNYELILDIDAARQNPKDMVDFANKQSEYENLKSEEQILDKLFDQTKYRAGINKMAEELANHFIQNLNKNGLEQSVNDLVTAVKQPAIGGRSR